MKSTLLCIVCTGFLCLLLASNINAEDDFKKDFGREIGVAFKSEMRKLFQSIIKASEEFYNIIIKDITLTKDQTEIIKGRITSLEEIKSKISDDISANLIDGIAHYIREILLDILRFGNKIEISDEKQNEIVQIEIGNFARKEDEAINIFIDNIHKIWTNSIKTVPEEEKQNHLEYTKITDLIEKTYNTERIPQTNNKTRNAAMRETFEAIIDFFGFIEWKKIFSQA